ncbi:alpha/beta hydrolase [Marinomonas ostreistagni]|uniref:alpha/beta hydrolase n=1 Tax=Marinomonas ostreistagni TaxID=359209 RepID=UPI00194E4988|nr:alpha/beta hydrolase [Marinomonas ostreistagni]MBM6550151.1 alpha/beta hydrolase [Marinomonas ostreistagni]
MKSIVLGAMAAGLSLSAIAAPQMPDHIRNKLPEGTFVHENVAYKDSGNVKHLLDLYMPADPSDEQAVPLVVLIHGGGWISNDKYADMGYMMNTVASILDSGFAVASVDYRFAQDAVFPLIVQDVNAGVAYLYDHADEYKLDIDNIALMGFSAGGHLASLMGTSQNNKVDDLYEEGDYRPFEYKAVVDFYGPVDLTLFDGNEDPNSPEGTLIGAAPIERPDLAKAASPITYIDKNDPPFILFHGEKDQIVSNKQSKLFSAWLTHYDVSNRLTIVDDAPHFGRMYDVDEIRTDVVGFLKQHLN